MQNALWNDEPLSRPKADRSSFQINGQFAFYDIEEFILVIMFVPMILALDHTNPHHGSVYLAKRLVKPRNMSISKLLLVDDL